MDKVQKASLILEADPIFPRYILYRGQRFKDPTPLQKLLINVGFLVSLMKIKETAERNASDHEV